MGSDIQAMTDYKTPSSPSPVRTTQTFWISSAHTLEGLKLPIKHLQGTTSWWADTQCWNTCCVEPTVIDLNDHTVALTSIRMKCFERLVKDDILSSLLQFACRPNKRRLTSVLHHGTSEGEGNTRTDGVCGFQFLKNHCTTEFGKQTGFPGHWDPCVLLASRFPHLQTPVCFGG